MFQFCINFHVTAKLLNEANADWSRWNWSEVNILPSWMVNLLSLIISQINHSYMSFVSIIKMYHLKTYHTFLISDSNTCWSCHRVCHTIHPSRSLCPHPTTLPQLWLGKWLWTTMVEGWFLQHRNSVKEDKVYQNLQHSHITGTRYWGEFCWGFSWYLESRTSRLQSIQLRFCEITWKFQKSV
jgi:hypothetical protein